MPIMIANRSFEGPYRSTDSLQLRSGVYVILCAREGRNDVVDVGEAGPPAHTQHSGERHSALGWGRC